MLKKKIFSWLEKNYYPHIYFFPSPFKIYEYRAMEKRGALRPEHTILDVGCGHGVQTRLLALRAKRAVGIDPSPDAVGRAKANQALGRMAERCEYRLTTIEQAGFADQSFDRVFSVCVLEHIPDDESVLRHCYRVLKPGGKLVFSIDSLATIRDATVKNLHKERYAVCRYYTAEAIREKLVAAGFANIRVTPLLRSQSARRWFEDGIRGSFALRYSEAILKYWWLRLIEPWASGPDGLYLLIEGEKPR